jgi:hypothetical protein
MRTKKQKLFLYSKLVFLVLFVGIITTIFFRNTILESAISRIDTKLKRDYQCIFHVKSAQFHGLSDLEFEEISLVPQKADTLVSIKNLKTSAWLYSSYSRGVIGGFRWFNKGMSLAESDAVAPVGDGDGELVEELVERRELAVVAGKGAAPRNGRAVPKLHL